MEKLFILALFLYIAHVQEQWLFYRDMKKFCKKHKGICENCSCWSCPRKLYIDEYIIKKTNSFPEGS